MRVGFEQAGPPAAPEQLDDAERRLGVKLPAGYRSFLEEQNGGFLEPNFFDDSVTLRQLFSIGQTEIEHLGDVERRKEEYSDGGVADYVLPEFLLPVGMDDFGNLICLSTDEADFGTVYFWDHEEADDDLANLTLGIDFPQFVERLRPTSEFNG